MRRVRERKGGAVTVTEMQLRRNSFGVTGNSGVIITGPEKIVASFNSDADFTNDGDFVYISYDHGKDSVIWSASNTDTGADVGVAQFTDTGGTLTVWFYGDLSGANKWTQNVTLTMVG